MTPMITPNSPMALAKISIIRILTNRRVSCASASAAPAPKNKAVDFEFYIIENG